MKCSTQAALAIGAGYLLGRRRKMRMAALLAAGAATGGLGGLGGAALKRGMKMLGNTEALGKVAPQLGEIADTVRGDLLDAGKAAAIAAVNGRIESLTDNLHERAETLRNPADAATGAAADAGEAVTGKVRRRRRAADEDGADEDGYDEEDRPEDADESAEADEPEDLDEADDFDEPEDEDEPEEDELVRSRPARRRSPVARARR